MAQRILVTGFKPFLGETINPSERILGALAQNQVPGVETLLLPVSYKEAFKTLQEHWKKHGPYEALLMLGQAGGRATVSLERIAINWSESKYPDEEQFQHPVGPIQPNAPTSYISDFFPNSWVETLSALGPTSVSHSAGTYVCNSLYFQALHQLPKGTRILFTHVPYLPEQVKDKATTTASMDLATQIKIITELVRLMKES